MVYMQKTVMTWEFILYFAGRVPLCFTPLKIVPVRELGTLHNFGQEVMSFLIVGYQIPFSQLY